MRKIKQSPRLRRAAKTRSQIARDRKLRIVTFRSGRHIYAQVVDPDHKVLLSASSLEKDVRKKLKSTSSIDAATKVGESLATKVQKAKISENLAFDRGGYKYHGRIKALAEGIRAAGVTI